MIGPLLAAALLGTVGFKGVFLLSVIPGFLAAATIWRLVRETPRPSVRSARMSLGGLPGGAFRRLAVPYGLYGLGNFAPTLLVLRATDLLHQGRTPDRSCGPRRAPVHGPQPRSGSPSRSSSTESGSCHRVGEKTPDLSLMKLENSSIG